VLEHDSNIALSTHSLSSHFLTGYFLLSYSSFAAAWSYLLQGKAVRASGGTGVVEEQDEPEGEAEDLEGLFGASKTRISFP